MLCWCPHGGKSPILRSICDCKSLSHTHEEEEDEGLPSVPSAISQSTPQLGPSLPPPAPPPTPPTHTPITLPGGLWRLHGGEWLAFFWHVKACPGRVCCIWCDPFNMAAGLTAVTQKPATVMGYHGAGPATQLRHLCCCGGVGYRSPKCFYPSRLQLLIRVIMIVMSPLKRKNAFPSFLYPLSIHSTSTV